MRFIHTSDWHIGRSFRAVGDAHKRAVFKESRLDVIREIAAVARGRGALDVLVAGDVYDALDAGDVVLRQPLERMREAADIRWHLIPGNHDPDRPGGVWERLARVADLPENVTLHRSAGPVALRTGVCLLPAPLRERAQTVDPTAWMDDAPSPEGALRIGLAHGPVTDFGRLEDPERSAVANLIAPDRAKRAGLAYLALGDWHAPKKIDELTWYPGTPEADGFTPPERGAVLLVEVAGNAAAPVVEEVPVGRYVWGRESVSLDDPAALDRLLARVRAMAPADGLARLCLRLDVTGAPTLTERARFEDDVVAFLESALAHLRLEAAGLVDAPVTGDLDAIAAAGPVRLAAERLHARAGDEADPERERALAALRLLYREQRRAALP